MKMFVIDVAKCVGCRSCEIVCKDEHVDNDWSPIALPQPDTGQHWVRVEEKERGQVPKVTVAYTPIMCQHCKNAPCMAVAKDGFPTHSGWPWAEPTSHTNLVQQPVQSWKEAAPQLGCSLFPITASRLCA